ncbi:hypothetical protein GVN16_12235 [Emticicia sp. CRIBPO]|uniref:S41 family peptidase n=1 Tax=Emticicia sp. CRIBPO TaxID=2683258 RepID=UPI0014124D6C|nr:S41 family peptidase [Emticicia sp. CRIBPO]NBA86537.1 hypothetical protein [Emticicia sp. CRIBPO]
MKPGQFPTTLWGRKFIAFFFVSLFFCQVILAQQKLAVIRANSNKVSIKDGSVYQKGIWNISPEIRPDVYQTLEPRHEKTIVFYTDIDSISVKVAPQATYDFIILLNNRDSCYTRISNIKPVKEPEKKLILTDLLSPEKLKQDFTTFRVALEKEHAGLYRYKSKKEMDAIFDRYFAALDHPVSPIEFGKTVLSVISALQDGHTRSNVPRLLGSYYSDNIKVFSLFLYFIENKAYVLCGQELPAQAEILTIDGQSVADIQSELFRYLPSDGTIETKKRSQLNDGAFPILYHWIFGDKHSFRVEFKNKNGETGTINLAGKSVKDIECDFRNKPAVTKPLQLDFLQNNVALLTVKSFDDNRINAAQLNFREFLETSFKEINTRKISTLIIDVRNNGGGADDYGALLYSYLTGKPFKYFASKSSVTSAVTLQENPLLGFQQPQKNNFTGNILFLINGVSFSTTADFCSIARSQNRGKFIGEETGGGYYGNTSGKSVTITLNNSQIEVTIPQFKYVNDVKKAKYKDRGTIPDYIVLPSIEDVILNKDVQLNYALKLANTK